MPGDLQRQDGGRGHRPGVQVAVMSDDDGDGDDDDDDDDNDSAPRVTRTQCTTMTPPPVSPSRGGRC